MSIEHNVKFLSKLLTWIKDNDLKVLVGVTTTNKGKVIIHQDLKDKPDEVKEILLIVAADYKHIHDTTPTHVTDK